MTLFEMANNLNWLNMGEFEVDETNNLISTPAISDLDGVALLGEDDWNMIDDGYVLGYFEDDAAVIRFFTWCRDNPGVDHRKQVIEGCTWQMYPDY